MSSTALYPRQPILMIDDDPTWLSSFSNLLEFSAGYTNLLCCSDSREVAGLLAAKEIGLVLLDLHMPHLGGEDLLPQITRDFPEVPIIVLSGVDRVHTAVNCMKLGAFDYFVKTSEQTRILAGINRALSIRELQRENAELKSRVVCNEVRNPEVFRDIVTRSENMHALFAYLEAVARSSEPLLISGESGTGKELFARAYHRLGGEQSPFVAVNVAGLDDTVFSDTLFGHVRGAFTGANETRPGVLERASGGTLFLDEIGDLSAANQIKLLRLLQEREYYPLGSDQHRVLNARLVFATNVDLDRALATGAFRRDLYYRLKAHQVHIPPLRDRTADIPVLLKHFLREAAEKLEKRIPTAPAELAVLLANYSFPGNVREMRALVFNAVSLHRSGILSTEAFRVTLKERGPTTLPDASDVAENMPDFRSVLPMLRTLPSLKKAAEYLVEEAMRRTHNNQSLASRLLGVTQPALSKRLKKSREP